MIPIGRQAEYSIVAWLKGHGIKSKLAPEQSPFDIRVGKMRVEVKASEFNGKLWQFNIHRHNVLDESQVDFYVFRLLKFPTTNTPINLIIKAPIGSKSVVISMRSLFTRYSAHYNRLDLLRRSA